MHDDNCGMRTAYTDDFYLDDIQATMVRKSPHGHGNTVKGIEADAWTGDDMLE